MMGEKTKRRIAAPAPKIHPTEPVQSEPHVPPVLYDADLDRLPEDMRSAISLATRTGRYYIAVVRLDSEFRQLNLQRYIQDMPTADNDRIVTMIREDLANVR